MSNSVETFQISTQAAEVYEHKFVPALFGEWAKHLVDAADVGPGQAVIDIACGTGVVARTVAERLAGSGRVVGVDINEGMLAVARRTRPNIEWHQGDALELPFPDAAFDAALCQASLMYFPDRLKALAEMARIVRPGGTVAVQVWAGLDSQPGFRPFADIVARHAGRDAVDLIGSYFSLGDLDLVVGLFRQAGLSISATRTRRGAERFDSIDEFVRSEIESTPLIDRIDEDVYARILDEARGALASFVSDRGKAEIPIEGHLIVAQTR